MKTENYIFWTIVFFSILSVFSSKQDFEKYLVYLLIEIQVKYRYEIYPLFILIAGVGLENFIRVKNKILN